MESKSTLEEDSDSPGNKYRSKLLLMVYPDRRHNTTLIDDEHDKNQLRFSSVSRRGSYSRVQLSLEVSDSLTNRPEAAGKSLHSLRVTLPAPPTADECKKEETVNEGPADDDFHDSDVDVYDLYNACNGELYQERLDIRKLDELTLEEAEILNVPRLKEIWHHTTLGCRKCEKIILTLNAVRDLLREDLEESATEESKTIAVDQNSNLQ